jgi:hypothetical protein
MCNRSSETFGDPNLFHIGNQLPSGNSMMSPNVSEDRLHMYQLSSENIGNQLPSGNSMMSPNVSEDRLHMYQLISNIFTA